MRSNESPKPVQGPVNTTPQSTPRMLRAPEVVAITGLGKTTLYREVKEGRFPSPVRLSRRLVAWRSEDVSTWIYSRGNSAAD